MGFFMNVTLQAAVHLGRDYGELRFTKNQLLKSVEQLFQVTERLVKDQTEMSGLFTAYVESDDSTIRQSCCDHECQNLRLSQLRAMSGRVTVSTSSSSVNSSIASRSPGILKVGCSGKPHVRPKRNSNTDAASSSQGWHEDALPDVCTGKPVETDKDQESLNFPETVRTGKLVAPGYEGYPGTQELQEIQKTRKTKAEFGHTISMYHQTVYLTWRKSSRLQDKLMAEIRRMI